MGDFVDEKTLGLIRLGGHTKARKEESGGEVRTTF